MNASGAGPRRTFPVSATTIRSAVKRWSALPAAEAPNNRSMARCMHTPDLSSAAPRPYIRRSPPTFFSVGMNADGVKTGRIPGVARYFHETRQVPPQPFHELGLRTHIDVRPRRYLGLHGFPHPCRQESRVVAFPPIRLPRRRVPPPAPDDRHWRRRIAESPVR
jgi:hypothetical protein